MPSNNRRNFGLDVLRAAAIMMVLLSHMAGALNLFGIYGVELFFVLSGFLIGDILIQTAARLNRFAFEDLTEFWKRRWFRTLPNYYLFLVLYLVEWFARYSADGAAPTDVYLYPFFLQNFAWPFVNEEGRYFFPLPGVWRLRSGSICCFRGRFFFLRRS
jgi:peptidoglycan/LPS O-acetylase OafA/YrhL